MCSADLLGREPDDPVFHKGVYFGVYELVIGHVRRRVLVGCVMFLVRRLARRRQLRRSPADVGILVLLIAIGVTGYVVEGLRIIHAETPLPGLVAGRLSRRALRSRRSASTSMRPAPIHFALWWTHALLALGFIALMPYTRLLHSLAGTVNLAIRDHSLGVMTPVSMEEVEATGQIGVGAAGRLLAPATDRARRLRFLRPVRGQLPGVRSRQAALAAQRGAGSGRRR